MKKLPVLHRLSPAYPLFRWYFFCQVQVGVDTAFGRYFNLREVMCFMLIFPEYPEAVYRVIILMIEVEIEEVLTADIFVVPDKI